MLEKNSPEKIFLYHYIEELISDYGKYYNTKLKDENLTIKEFSVLLRIKIEETTTQHDLVDLFKVSDAYIAKLLRKFEDEGYIIRRENPNNRRKKIVNLTDKGIEKTDKLCNVISNWEEKVTSNLTKKEKATIKKILYKITMGDD